MGFTVISGGLGQRLLDVPELADLPVLEGRPGRREGLRHGRHRDAGRLRGLDLLLHVRRRVLAVVDVDLDLLARDLPVDPGLVARGGVGSLTDRAEEGVRGEHLQSEAVGERADDGLRGTDRGARVLRLDVGDDRVVRARVTVSKVFFSVSKSAASAGSIFL